MELFVNGFSTLGATNKEEMAAATLKEIKRKGYTVIGQPVVKLHSAWSKEYKVYVPVISKSTGMPAYCVRTFGITEIAELEKVPFIDLTEKTYRR